MVEVVRTNFAPIFSDFQKKFGHSGTNRSATKRKFRKCPIIWKGLFFRKKRCKPNLNRSTNADVMSYGSNSTTHQSGRRPWRVIYKETRQKQLETKAMPLLRQCNTGRICVTLHIITLQQKKILPAYTHCSENHSITCAENKRFYI